MPFRCRWRNVIIRVVVGSAHVMVKRIQPIHHWGENCAKISCGHLHETYDGFSSVFVVGGVSCKLSVINFINLMITNAFGDKCLGPSVNLINSFCAHKVNHLPLKCYQFGIHSSINTKQKQKNKNKSFPPDNHSHANFRRHFIHFIHWTWTLNMNHN